MEKSTTQATPEPPAVVAGQTSAERAKAVEEYLASFPTLVTVLGENLRRIREERRLTQHELARHLHSRGLRWPRGRLAALEAGGREHLSLDVMLLLADALEVPLTALFAGEGDVRVGKFGRQSRAGVRAALSGKRPRTGGDEMTFFDDEAATAQLAAWDQEADAELARRLNVTTKRVVKAATDLWGHPLTVERDERTYRLDPAMSTRERQAHRGHITRELQQLVESKLRPTRKAGR